MITLPFYKSYTSEYLASDLAALNLKTQGLYFFICQYYWNESCKLTIKQLKRRLKEPCDDELKELLDESFVCEKNGDIVVKYLDKQFKELTKARKAQSAGGRKGRRKQNESTFEAPLKVDTGNPQHIEEDKDEEKEVDENSPSLSDVIEIFTQLRYTQKDCELAHLHYSSQGWCDGAGKPIVDWKLHLRKNWFDKCKRLPPKPEDMSEKERFKYLDDLGNSRNQKQEIEWYELKQVL